MLCSDFVTRFRGSQRGREKAWDAVGTRVAAREVTAMQSKWVRENKRSLDTIFAVVIVLAWILSSVYVCSVVFAQN